MIRLAIITIIASGFALHMLDKVERGGVARQSGELCGYAVGCRP